MSVGVFNVNYYRQVNQDLRGMTEKQAYEHFLNYGLAEGRSFSAFVDLNFYRAANSDLASLSNVQAYEHLQNYGIKEGRCFSPFFDLNFYRPKNGDLADFSNEQLFGHLQNYGINEGRTFSPFFDLNFYRSMNGDLASLNNQQLFNHFIDYGLAEGRCFSTFVNLDFYRQNNRDLASFNNHQALQHLELHGVAESRLFSEVFDVNYYKSVNQDLIAAGLDNFSLYNHFLVSGISEGRVSSANFNVRVYLANNPDLQAAKFNNQQAYQHFVLYGIKEGRFGSDYAGNTGSTARNINSLSNSIRFTDFVGNGDADDYYRFSLNQTSNFYLALNNLSADLGVELLDSGGEAIARSNQPDTVPKSIEQVLNAGDYYIRVNSSGHNNTNYNLTVSATKQQITQIFAGTLRSDTFSLANDSSRYVFSGNGNVDFSTGALDLLNLEQFSSTSVTFNYANTSTGGVMFNPGNGTRVFDALTLNDGREILFENIEAIKFADKTINLSVIPNDPLFNQQWNLHAIGVHNAWRLTTGSNAVQIGIVDTGLGKDISGNDHPDLPTTIGYSYNLPDENAISHGSHVEGAIAATANNGIGIAGINWNSPVFHVDVVSSVSSGDAGDIFLDKAIETTIGTLSNGRRLVVNISLSGGYSQKLEQLIAANQDRALFVISSGNNDRASLSSPADLASKYENVVAVGASWGVSDSSGNPRNPGERISYPGWWGSNYGEGLTLMAPSEYYTTTATLASSKATAPFNFAYLDKFNGTSAATPNVTGVASLVWSVNTQLTAAQIKQILSQTAKDLGQPGYDTVYGWGFINADAAVRRAIAIGRGGEY